MRYWPFLILISITNFPEIKAQSTLLENVKQNPNEAIALCKKFKRLNDQGISASSKETINQEIILTRKYIILLIRILTNIYKIMQL